mmetsp:Transcript_37384/g.67572  ORF Transcript_37384/g.67572 Transcript_37384/m.67572 type:complete len:114 (+) Transcript_37384:88-429(+)
MEKPLELAPLLGATASLAVFATAAAAAAKEPMEPPSAREQMDAKRPVPEEGACSRSPAPAEISRRSRESSSSVGIHLEEALHTKPRGSEAWWPTAFPLPLGPRHPPVDEEACL